MFESLAFDRLALDFWIDSRGISIAGRCTDTPGAVAVAGGHVLLTDPPGQPQPVAALIQALVPSNAAGLARLLPIPDAGRTN